MDSDDKKLLKETFALTEENNKMLKKVRGVQKREAIWSTLKIIIVVGIALGSFYYIEPYLNKMIDIYSSITGIEKKMNSSSIQDLLKKF
ncbi:MAG: hypothetical protein AAB873_00365 [Patescibacteria group bacterium]